MRRSPRVDLLGMRFGRGVVLSVSQKLDKHKRTFWNLLCDCGTEYQAATGPLNAGRVRSCGCLMIERVTENIKRATEANTMPSGHAARNELFALYRARAQKAGIEFSLSSTTFFGLTQMPCWYCESQPSSRISRKSGAYVYSGLDRVDSLLGYTDSNVVPCCKRCNQAKNDMSLNEFIGWLKLLQPLSRREWSLDGYFHTLAHE